MKRLVLLALGCAGPSGSVSALPVATPPASSQCAAGQAPIPDSDLCGERVAQGCVERADPDKVPRGEVARAVTFVLENTTEQTLYLPRRHSDEAARVDLILAGGAALRSYEDVWCRCDCPGEGPPACKDCGRAPQRFVVLEPGATLQTVWDGRVQGWVRRWCPDLGLQGCGRAEAVGTARLQARICGHTQATFRGPGGTEVDTVGGEQRCAEVVFDHPAERVLLRLSRPP